MAKGYTPAMLISDEAMQLLANAEAIVYETECMNHCAHFTEGVRCGECGHFAADPCGYIRCGGYVQKGEVAA